MKKLTVQNQSISFRIGINKPMFRQIVNGTQKLFITKINVPNHFNQIVFRNGNDAFLVKNPTFIYCQITNEGVFIRGKKLTEKQENILQSLCGNPTFMGFGEFWLIVLSKSIYNSSEGLEFLHKF